MSQSDRETQAKAKKGPETAPRGRSPVIPVPPPTQLDPAEAKLDPRAPTRRLGPTPTPIGAITRSESSEAMRGSALLPAAPSGASPRAGSDALRRASRVDRRPADALDRARVQLTPGAKVPGTEWVIVRWTGDSSLGTTYEASKVDDAHHRVGIQVFGPDVGGDLRAVRMGKAEARVASGLKCRYLTEVVEFSQLSDGRLLEVVELLDGRRLADESEPMEPGRLIGIFRQVAKGLGEAHSVGVVHGDFRPDNLWLTTFAGRGDAVKITDFGVASLVGSDRDLGSGAGGSPYYVSPERIEGAARAPAMDIYGLGCVAYEALTGRPPFIADRVSEVLDGHRQERPAPMSSVAGCQVPAPLERVILRCLAKDPSDRYATMDEVEAALCQAQIEAGLRSQWDDLPLPSVNADTRARLERGMAEVVARFAPTVQVEVAKSDSGVDREDKWSEPVSEVEPDGPLGEATPVFSPTRMWGWLAAVGIVVAGGLGVRAMNDDAPPKAPVAETPAPAAEPAPAPAVGQPAEAAETPAETREATSRASSELDPEQARTQAKALVNQGRIALRSGQREQARALFLEAVEHNERAHRALAGLSDLYFEDGAYEEALKFARQAMAAWPQHAAYRMKLGDAYYKVLKYREAREQYARAAKLGHPGAEARLRVVDKKLRAK